MNYLWRFYSCKILCVQLQVPTPPGSNKPAGSEDGGSLNSTNSLLVRPPRGSGTCGTGILRPEELSKMFPTPPSLEHNPNASPCGGQLSDTPTHESVSDYLLPATLRIKQETYPDMGSPPEEPIEVSFWKKLLINILVLNNKCLINCIIMCVTSESFIAQLILLCMSCIQIKDDNRILTIKIESILCPPNEITEINNSSSHLFVLKINMSPLMLLIDPFYI